MKHLSILSILLLTALPIAAQTSFSAGINGAGSTSRGFWGMNPTVEATYQIAPFLNADLRINGFYDLGPNEKFLPNSTEEPIQIKDYHRSLYADVGLNIKIVDRLIDWSVGGGGTYQIGSEQYVGFSHYSGGILMHYEMENTNFSRFGIFVKNTLDLGPDIRLNITVYRFDFWGEYMSLGPSFRLN